MSSAFAYAGMAKEDIDILREQLSEHSLVVIKEGKTEVYDGRGIKPLVDYVRNKDFERAYAGDKVIGKAAALLFVYGGAKYVYTPLISKPAVEVFKSIMSNTEQIKLLIILKIDPAIIFALWRKKSEA